MRERVVFLFENFVRSFALSKTASIVNGGPARFHKAPAIQKGGYMRARLLIAMGTLLAATALVVAQSPSGVLELASVNNAGVQGDNDSGTTGFTSPSNDRASMTPDGRFVAFTSLADNLVPGDTNLVADVFVHDRMAGTTERVSLDSKGREGDAHSGLGTPTGAGISADGRFVVFASSASTFGKGDVNGNADVFVRDRLTGTTELISRGLDGVPASGDAPVISADGRIVAFRSFADTLVSDGNPNFTAHVYAFDRQTQTMERVDVDSNGVLANSQADNLAISADGRYVAFDTFADNLVAGPGDQDGVDVFVRDRVNHTTEGISTVGDSGVFEGNSFLSSITPDGRFVGFSSADPTLGVPDANGVIEDAFVFDRQNRTVTLVSRGSSPNRNNPGVQGNDSSFSPLVSADGSSVVFSSRASNLVANDTNGVFDVFRRNLVTNTTVRIAADTASPAFDVIASDVTPDGLIVSLLTRAALLPEQPVGFFAFDVYVLNLRPAADVAVTKNDSPDPVAFHGNLTYTITVQNLGPSTARDVTVFDRLPVDAVFVSATPAQGTCTLGNGLLTCSAGTLNAFASTTVTIVVSPSRAGATLTNTATVRASSPDPALANNTATATTTVSR
jgi:uncharacterized repeat protein (TIGR01451 family)